MTLTQLQDRNERYTQKVLAYLRQLEQYSTEQLNQPAPDGGWSVLQNLHHLALAETYSLQYIRKKTSSGADKLPSVGLSGRWRGFLMWLYLTWPGKIKAPAGVSTEALPAHSTLAETRAAYEQVRGAWTAYLADIPPDLLNKAVYKHPIVGRVGFTQTFIFFNAHFDRHVRQMRRLIATL
jgi:DinB superfamily